MIFDEKCKCGAEMVLAHRCEKELAMDQAVIDAAVAWQKSIVEVSDIGEQRKLYTDFVAAVLGHGDWK